MNDCRTRQVANWTCPSWPWMRRQAERLCAAVAPVDGELPNICRVSDLGREWLDARNDGWRGLYIAPGGVQCRKRLRRRWRGEVGAIIVDVARVAPETVVHQVLVTTLHELAHAFDMSGQRYAEHSEPAIVASVATYATKPPCGPRAAVPWAGHGKRWLRAMVHLHFRAGRVGFAFDLASTAAGKFYGLSSAELYRGALGDEPEQMVGAPFVEILGSPERFDFAALWERDLRRLETRKWPGRQNDKSKRLAACHRVTFETIHKKG